MKRWAKHLLAFASVLLVAAAALFGAGQYPSAPARSAVGALRPDLFAGEILLPATGCCK